MHVLAINGSPHRKGCTATALELVANELESVGITVELIQIGHLSVHGCNACHHCRTSPEHDCIFSDDPVNELRTKAHEADGILLGSPVYYAGIAGTMKCFLDRFFFAGAGLEYKVGAAVVSLRRTGGIHAFHQLNNYFNLAKVIITPSCYWNVIHGMKSEETLRDEEGVGILKALGQNMAWLMKSLEVSRQDFPAPQQGSRPITNFIH